MADDWNARIERFWATADDANPDATLEAMRLLVDERPTGDADALYELASAHDFVGREASAIPLYRRALAAGLSGDRYPQAMIQLSSSLRNVGEPDAAITLLEAIPADPLTGEAAAAFLALALHDAGRADDALRVALTALARTLPRYGRSVAAYASELGRSKGNPDT